MWRRDWRDSVWAELDRPWDIVIIGGGITGAGILREAGRAGLRVLLLEGKDFASGTSSRSSKLVHGGLRYLRNFQINTTRNSVQERDRLLQEGEGLITPLTFIFLNFESDKQPPWLFGLGLAVYDLLGLKWRHEHLRPEPLCRLNPGLTSVGLLGGYRYYDAQTDDARLVLRLIREGVRDGGVALNYARVEELLQRQDGQVCGVAFRDMAPGAGGRTAEVQGTVVINATGASADVLRGKVGGASRLRRLRGSHLFFPSSRLPLDCAISFAHPADQRAVFALPWESVTLFGTTDVDQPDEEAVEPAISAAEVDYLMTLARHAFPDMNLEQGDIQATHSGIRAVVDTGAVDPSKESREHVLWSEHGLLTVTGGKLTTFRLMAREALNLVRGQLPGRPPFRRHRLFEPVYPEQRQALEAALEVRLKPETYLRLIGRYGADLQALLTSAMPDELEPIGTSTASWAELRFAARAEGVVHLDDLLLRRVRLGLLLPEGGLPWIDQIRSIVQPELAWDDGRWDKEVAAYAHRWRSAYSLPGL